MTTQEALTTREQELAEYLQERIKPGLNRGSIPLLARSIATEIVQREGHDDESADGDPDEERDDREQDVDEEFDGEEFDGEPTARASDDDEPADDVEGESEDDVEEEPEDDAEEGPDGEEESPLDAFEAEMHELQAELGDEWVLRFSVQGDDAWLTAEKTDGTQHVEGPTAEVILEAVELLESDG